MSEDRQIHVVTVGSKQLSLVPLPPFKTDGVGTHATFFFFFFLFLLVVRLIRSLTQDGRVLDCPLVLVHFVGGFYHCRVVLTEPELSTSQDRTFPSNRMVPRRRENLDRRPHTFPDFRPGWGRFVTSNHTYNGKVFLGGSFSSKNGE